MGMRCVTGEKPDAWEKVALVLDLPVPTEDAAHYCCELGGDDAQAWFHLSSLFNIRAEIERTGATSGGSWAYLEEHDAEDRTVLLLRRHPATVALFMRLVGIMEAEYAKHEFEMSQMYHWYSTPDDPQPYRTWWTPPEGWTVETANLHEDEHEAWRQYGAKVAKEFRFIWG